MVGVVSFVLASVLISPAYIYFIGTQAVIAAYVHVATTHFRIFSRPWKIALAGIGLGIVAGIVSAPVIVYVFGGASGSGRDLVTALIIGSGQQIMKAVVLSGAASEPFDKTLQIFLAYLVIRSLPKRVRGRFSNSALRDNGLLS